MGIEELEGKNKAGGQKEDHPAGLKSLLQEIKGPGSKGDGGDLHHMAGIDQGGVLRCQGKDRSREEGTEASCADQAAEAIHTCPADEKVKYHIPGDACRGRDEPEYQVLEKQKAEGGRTPFEGKAAVDKLVPGRSQINLENVPEGHILVAKHSPVKLVDDIRGTDNPVGE